MKAVEEKLQGKKVIRIWRERGKGRGRGREREWWEKREDRERT